MAIHAALLSGLTGLDRLSMSVDERYPQKVIRKRNGDRSVERVFSGSIEKRTTRPVKVVITANDELDVWFGTESTVTLW